MSDQYAACEQLARAVAKDLNNAADGFAESFLATYDILPKDQLKNLTATKVTVRDIGQSGQVVSRSQSKHLYQIEVNVWKKLDEIPTSTMSRLKVLAEEICDFFRFIPSGKQYWPTGVSERLDSIESVAIGSDEDLQQLGLMRARIVLVFYGWRT